MSERTKISSLGTCCNKTFNNDPFSYPSSKTEQQRIGVPSSPVYSGLRLASTVCVAMLCRLLINTARRFAYPFAPVLSRGLGVSLSAVTLIISAYQMTGILGLIFAPLGDRWGYRMMLLTGLGVLSAGMLIGGLFPFYVTVFFGLFLAGLGKSIFDPALQAHIGKQISFSKRGMFIGIIEMSWAGSSLLGIPCIGLIIAHFGWRAPFYVLGAIGFLAMVTLGVLMVSDQPKPRSVGKHLHIYRNLLHLVRMQTARGAIGFVFCISAANDNLFVIYGAWLEQSFGLSIVALSMATTVIGVAELSGEALTATIADRFGPLKMITIGVILTAFSYLALPAFGLTLPLALIALFFVFIALEFSIVCSISLVTELLPDARATMMSGYLAAGSLGRVIGALMGGPIWMTGGIVAVGCVSAAITGVGLIFLRKGLSGWKPAETEQPSKAVTDF
ncbi:MAG: MFS transporter [Deltaproteobacteria bacterium]|nr:MFS transporter [Deltaproteobacteria bacterium]MBW1960785.1 MFS transporter [Deltaproteobacteria bacterium]MBW2153500.1 MFS transporter [Deltaproteobacteria bacterium]